MTSTLVQMSFLSDQTALSAFQSIKGAPWMSALLAGSVLPAQSRQKMNEDLITVIYFKSLLATISLFDLTTGR